MSTYDVGTERPDELGWVWTVAASRTGVRYWRDGTGLAAPIGGGPEVSTEERWRTVIVEAVLLPHIGGGPCP